MISKSTVEFKYYGVTIIRMKFFIEKILRFIFYTVRNSDLGCFATHTGNPIYLIGNWDGNLIQPCPRVFCFVVMFTTTYKMNCCKY